jgi:1-acyl-sn-glycerol-3-phosphate acyltransferase
MKHIRVPVYNVISFFLLFIQYTFTAVLLLCSFGVILFKGERVLRFGMKLWSKGVLWLMGKPLRVKGLDKIQKGKKYILLANHASLYDIPAVISFYPRASWLGRAYLTRIPVFGQFLRLTGFISIEPGNIAETRKVLRRLTEKSEDFSVVIFPEGTRTLDGKMQRFRRGFLQILKCADLDILPVTLNGFYALKPKNRSYIDLRVKIEAIIHEPVKREELMNKSDEEIMENMKRIIESQYKGEAYVN